MRLKSRPLVIWCCVLTTVALAVALMVVLFVLAKGHDYVSGDSINTIGGRTRLKPCDPLPDLQLEHLNTDAPATCDLGGARIEVSPGVVLTVPEFGMNVITDATPDGSEWGIVNLGADLGIVVYTSDEQWGNPEAVRLVRKAGWHIGRL